MLNPVGVSTAERAGWSGDITAGMFPFVHHAQCEKIAQCELSDRPTAAWRELEGPEFPEP